MKPEDQPQPPTVPTLVVPANPTPVSVPANPEPAAVDPSPVTTPVAPTLIKPVAAPVAETVPVAPLTPEAPIPAATVAPTVVLPVVYPTPTGPSVMPGTVAVAPSDSGKTLAIIALVLSFIMPVVGIVLGIMAQSKSKKSGNKNVIATIAIVTSAVFTVVLVGLIGYFIIQATSKQKITTPCYTLELPKKFVKVGDNTSCNIEFETKGGKDSVQQKIFVAGGPTYDIGVAKDDYLNQIAKIYEAAAAMSGTTLPSPNKTTLNGSQAYQYTLSKDGEYANIILTIAPKEYSVSGNDDKVGIFNVSAITKSSSSSSSSLLKEVSNSWMWAK